MVVICFTGIQIYKLGKIITQIANAGKPKKTIPAKIKCQIGNYFPNLNLNRVTYVEDASIPRNIWGIADGGGAVALGYTIYFSRKMNFENKIDFKFLIHELVHVNQYRIHGESDMEFACGYYHGYVKAGFSETENNWEKTAVRKAEEFDFAGRPECRFNIELYLTQSPKKSGMLHGYQGRTTWDIIVPGEFGGTGNSTDLLFYDKTKHVLEFYRIDSLQKHYMKRLKKYDNARTTWSSIISGQYGGSGGQEDLMFYDATAKEIEFYRIDPNAKYFMKKLKKFPNIRSSWYSIISGHFHGSGKKDDLMFYDRNAGQIEFYHVTDKAKTIKKK